jgi:hypothetical protein
MLKYLLAALAVAGGSWMGQFMRTAATVPDEAPPPPEILPEHLLPSFGFTVLLSALRHVSVVGTMLLAFNFAFIFSFMLGRRADRAWLRRARKG